MFPSNLNVPVILTVKLRAEERKCVLAKLAGWQLEANGYEEKEHSEEEGNQSEEEALRS